MSLSLRIFCNVKSLGLSINSYKDEFISEINMNLSLRIFVNTGPGFHECKDRSYNQQQLFPDSIIKLIRSLTHDC